MNLIHVGLPKAASTTLQDGLFSRQNRYAYFGKVHNHYVADGVRDLVARICYQDSLDFDREGTRSLVGALRRDLRVGERPILVSDEQFSVDGKADRRLMAERLGELFAPAKVLLVLRAQETLCESWYLHFLRSSGQRPMSFADWMDQTYDRPFLSIQRVGLDYDKLVSTFEEVFGAGNVVMLPFELLRSGSPLVSERLAQLLGTTPAWIAEALQRTSENVRQSKRYQFVLHIQKMLPTGTNFALLGRRLLPLTVYARIRDVVRAGPRVARPEMPERWRRRIAEVCGTGNARLQARSGLPLKDLGYACTTTE